MGAYTGASVHSAVNEYLEIEIVYSESEQVHYMVQY